MRKILVMLLIMLIFAVSVVLLSAHEGREVGDYFIEVGWCIEPACAGILNGHELVVENVQTGEPVEGLEATLSLMIHLSDQTKMLTIYPAGDEPGHYTTHVLPTRAGDCGFHLFGTIDDIEVDEMFTPADGDFSTIQPASDLQFLVLEQVDIAALSGE